MEPQQVTIISLAPVYQILATFFVAFIVIEYAKSYTMLIAKHIFDIDGILQQQVDESKIDKNTIQGELSGEKWSQDKGLKFKQKFIQSVDDYIESQKTAYNDIQTFKGTAFQFESFRYVSIYMFLYCMFCLYAGGLFVNFDHYTEVNFLMYEASISIVIAAAYFVFGYKQSLFNTTTRTINFYVVVVVMILCIIISSLLTWKYSVITEQYNLLATVVELLAAFVPSLAFIVGFVFVYYKSYQVKKKIKTTYGALKIKRKGIFDKLTKIKNFSDVTKEIENIEIEECDK